MLTVIKAESILTAQGILSGGISLLIRDGIIEQIGQSIKYGNELPVVDLNGFTICPTFCDYHLHFSKKCLSDIEALITVLLQHGITQVCDGGDRDFTGLICKKAVQDKIEIVTSSFALYRRGTYGSLFGIGVASVDEAKSLIDHAVVRGVDTVKVINSGVVDPQTGRISEGGFKSDVLKQVIDYAAKKGFPVTCHANGDRAVTDAVDAGVSTIVHGFFITPETLKKVADNNVTFIPTIYAFHSLIDRYDDTRARERIIKITEEHLHTIKLASDMGVKILAGSDARPLFLPYGKAFIEELRFLQKAGLSFEKVLMTAIKEHLRKDARADFLVLDDLRVHSVFLKGQSLTIS